MATLPTIFLESTLHAAKEHGVEAHPLPDNQGLLFFPEGLAISKRCTLLKKMAATLHGTKGPADLLVPHPAENIAGAVVQSTIDCQVSVEERTQLFKFLTG